MSLQAIADPAHKLRVPLESGVEALKLSVEATKRSFSHLRSAENILSANAAMRKIVAAVSPPPAPPIRKATTATVRPDREAWSLIRSTAGRDLSTVGFSRRACPYIPRRALSAPKKTLTG